MFGVVKDNARNKN